jgi:quinohemoprotein ethanol dehydrogenase
MKIRIAGISAAVAAGVVALVWLSNQSIGQPAAAPGANVDGAKIANADADPGEWLSHGRTYSEQRFSPLDKINTTNVENLGVAWEYRTYSVRGLEATPIPNALVAQITRTSSQRKRRCTDARCSRSRPAC